MSNANVLVPRGLDNTAAIDMLCKNIQRQLLAKSHQHLSDLKSLAAKSPGVTNNCIVINQTPQVRAIHSIICDIHTSRDDFIFYFDRIASILVSRALDLLPGTEKTVITPMNVAFHGVDLTSDICAVAIIRGGECFTRSLKKSIPTIRLGKLLIQSDSRTGEPKLHTLSLPPCVDPRPATVDGEIAPAELRARDNTQVLLVDSHLVSGAAAVMAAAILTDHSIPEENITFVAYTATTLALSRFSAAFPKIKVIVGRKDQDLYPRFVESAYYGTS